MTATAPKTIRMQPEPKAKPADKAASDAASELGGGVAEGPKEEEKTITLAMPPAPQRTRSFIADDENEPIPEELADRAATQHESEQPRNEAESLDLQGHTEQTVAEMRAGAAAIEKEVLDDEEYSSKTLAEMHAGRKRLEHWRRREANMPKSDDGPKNTIIRRGPKLPA